MLCGNSIPLLCRFSTLVASEIIIFSSCHCNFPLSEVLRPGGCWVLGVGTISNELPRFVTAGDDEIMTRSWGEAAVRNLQLASRWMMKQKGIRKVFFEGVPASKSENKKNGIFYKKQLKQVKGVYRSSLFLHRYVPMTRTLRCVDIFGILEWNWCRYGWQKKKMFLIFLSIYRVLPPPLLSFLFQPNPHRGCCGTYRKDLPYEFV